MLLLDMTEPTTIPERKKERKRKARISGGNKNQYEMERNMVTTHYPNKKLVNGVEQKH